MVDRMSQVIGNVADAVKPQRRKWLRMGIAGFVVVCGFPATAMVAQNAATVNYSSVVNSAATPYLFGGSNEPNPSDQATVYPMLKSVGVKFQRGDVHLDQVLPTGITVAEYQANTNGVANPSNWNWGPLSWVSEAKTQGFTTMANILYAPAWLTDSGTIEGVPSNWSVWQDIVTKIVEHEGSSLNYLEILNEPTCGFVSTSGSSYGSAGAAADDMYYYAAVAARAGNSSLIIGGDGDCQNSGSFGALSNIIPDSRLTSNLLQFVSYHIYSPTAAASDNIGTLETLLANNGRSGLPIFITEWNYNYTASTTDPHVVGDETITYVVYQFMLWSTQKQLAGVDIYSFIPNNEVLSPYEDCSGCDNIAQGFYSVNGSTTKLVTQSRAYQLMSVALGLGLGNFKVYSTSTSGLSGAQGFINANQNVAMVMTNDSAAATTATVTLTNMNASGCNFTVYIYTADTANNTAVSPTSTLTNQCISSGSMTLSNVALPSYSAVGVIVNSSTTLIPNGTYIVTSVKSGLAIDDPNSSTTDGEDMQIYTVNDGTNQQWMVNNLGNNVITLTNVASGQLLDVAGASKSNGALVDQWPANGQTNQQWSVISLGGGNYELNSVNSGLALDVIGGRTTNGTGIDQWPYQGNSWQQWRFTSY